MKVFLDTNVLLDHSLRRVNFVDEADRVLQVCGRSGNSAQIAFHTFTNLYYLIRSAKDDIQARRYLSDLVSWVSLAPTDKQQLTEVLLDSGGDLEDKLQAICARDGSADVIVTRDSKGFKNSPMKAMTPADFLSVYE